MSRRAKDITELLPALLAKVKRRGEYCGSGSMEVPVVRIAVDGVGTLGLPISQSQAMKLSRVAEPAPYGRGQDTLVDRDVRRCGQVAADKVHADDARWNKLVTTIAASAAAALGVDGTVDVELYKLLVYRPGDFFSAHRDTEKAPGMFATLVVALPSEHDGGELLVRHDGRESVLDLSGRDLGVARWAAFYADCQHELRPLRSGHRIALVYNLVRQKGRSPQVPDRRPEVARVAKALRAWEADPDTPVKVVFPLKHQYSLAELTFAALKNEDAAVADVLEVAAHEADCVVRLAMVSIEESGSAEPHWDGPSRYWGGYADDEDDDEGGDDESSYDVIELDEREQTLDGWRRPDDTPEPLGRIPYEDHEVAPPGALADEEPDEDRLLEASGNEGCSFERTYRRAALVLWPSSRELQVVHQGGPEAGIGVLERFFRDPGEAAPARKMAGMLVDDWPRPQPNSDWLEHDEHRARLIAALTELEDTEPLQRFLEEVVGAGAFDGSETPAMVLALDRFDERISGRILARVASGCAAHRFAPVAQLLRAVGRSRPGQYLSVSVASVVAAMPTLGDDISAWDDKGSAMNSRGAGLLDLVDAAGAAGDLKVAGRLVDATLGHPERWPFDGVLVPAALEFSKRGNAVYKAVTEQIRSACLDHLGARIALPLSPPPDAVRSNEGLTCACEDCSSLRSFLSHPVTRVWSLRAAKRFRQHVESVIRHAQSDVGIRTDTRGNPHTLFCTKTQASYEARVRQRAADLSALAVIGGRGRVDGRGPKRAV